VPSLSEPDPVAVVTANAPLDTVAQVTAAINSAGTLTEMYDAALDGLRTAFGVDRTSILLFDPDGVMRFKAWRGLSAEYRRAVEGHTPWTSGQAAPAPVVVNDVRLDSGLRPQLAVFEREQIGSLAFFPLVSARGVIGKFMLYRGTGAFPIEQVTAAHTIGFVLGYAVERTASLLESQRERERILFALDAASMGTWQWDLRTHEVVWSENLERIHGLPERTFTRGFASYEREIHPDDRARVLASLQRAIREDVPHDVEYRIVAPDGTTRWVHGRGRVERDDTGQPISMSGICMDISARRLVEEENQRLYADTQRLLGLEELLRGRLTTLTDGSYRLLTSLTPAAVVSEVLELARQVVPADAYAVWRRFGDRWIVAGSHGLSDSFVSVTLAYDASRTPFLEPIVAVDLSRPELTGRSPAYQVEGIESLVSVPLVARDEPRGSIVFYFKRKHQPSDVELRVAIALGQLAAAAISNAELYEEQQALRRLSEAAEVRAHFLADASARLSSLDYENSLRQVAQLAVSQLCDWCTVDLLGSAGDFRRVTIAHVEPTKIALAEALNRRYPVDLSEPRGIGEVLRTGRPELYADISDAMLVQAARDEEHLRALREIGVTSAMLVPLSTGTRVMGVLSFIRSSVDRHFNQDDLEVACELGRRAAYAIENARLYSDAQHANRLKDEFLATLSHELRTPLNVIAGRAHLLSTAADSEQVRTIASVIDRNSTTLTRLVDDLLDVSRMTIGQVRLERQLVSLTTIVVAAVQGIQASAAAKDIAITHAIEPDAMVVGDPTRLQQIAWNLLTNAVKFTPAGGRIEVVGRALGEEVTLAVTDSGRGLSPDALPRIFDMFWQAESLPSRQEGGLGLGLSIVKKLAELQGGHVTAASEGPGRGATFTVTLPLAPPPGS
jgi:PAS domain S-box-containing protein